MRTKAFVSIRNVAATIALLIFGVATVSVLLVMAVLLFEDLYVYAAIAFLLVVWAVWHLIVIYTKSVRKATFMFNAIDNDDYTFTFAVDASLADDAILNEALNRIKEILENAKRNVIEREKYYELIMSSVRTGIITLNDSGSVYQVNGEALRIFGLSVFTHINQLRPIDATITDAMRNLEPGEKRQLTFHNERGEVAVSLTASAVTLQDKPLKIIAVSDINSELAEKELESWMRLIRILTHEIMNSLAPITSLSDTLISLSRNKEGNIAQGLKTINATSKSLISFVESYRKFTNIPVPVKKPFSLRELLERAVSLQGVEAEISLSMEPDDTLLYADEDQIGQVAINLIKNAAEAVARCAAPSIEITSRIDEAENIIIDFSNNGGAISGEVAENIFLPFFTTKEGGSGIGLSLSRQIMRLHGGSLRMTSNTESKVTFTLTF